jgi:hypothetical protein
MPVTSGTVYICFAPYRCPIKETIAIADTPMPSPGSRPGLGLEGPEEERRAEEEEGGGSGHPMRIGAADADWPQGRSKKIVSMPRLAPVRCSHSVSAPKASTIPAKTRPIVRQAGRSAAKSAHPLRRAQNAGFGNIEIPSFFQSVSRGASTAQPTSVTRPPRTA